MANNFDPGRGRGKKSETHEGGRERRRIRTGDLFHGRGIALGSAIAGTGESAGERAGDDPGTDTFRGHAQYSGVEERIEAETDLSSQTSERSKSSPGRYTYIFCGVKSCPGARDGPCPA